MQVQLDSPRKGQSSTAHQPRVGRSGLSPKLPKSHPDIHLYDLRSQKRVHISPPGSDTPWNRNICCDGSPSPPEIAIAIGKLSAIASAGGSLSKHFSATRSARVEDPRPFSHAIPESTTQSLKQSGSQKEERHRTGTRQSSTNP